MYAIIATGGKQYKVAEGDIIKVEKLGVDAGETVTFDQVLAVSNGDLSIGCPTVAGQLFPEPLSRKARRRRLLCTSIRGKLAITRRMATDSFILRSRLTRSMHNYD